MGLLDALRCAGGAVCALVAEVVGGGASSGVGHRLGAATVSSLHQAFVQHKSVYNLWRGSLPHLQRAVELHAAFDVLDAERALYAGTVDRLDVGTAIVDEDGRVTFAPPPLPSLVAAGDVRVSVLAPALPAA